MEAPDSVTPPGINYIQPCALDKEGADRELRGTPQFWPPEAFDVGGGEPASDAQASLAASLRLARGSPGWCGDGFSQDVWSLGVTLHEMVTGAVPWPQHLTMGTYSAESLDFQRTCVGKWSRKQCPIGRHCKQDHFYVSQLI